MTFILRCRVAKTLRISDRATILTYYRTLWLYGGNDIASSSYYRYKHDAALVPYERMLFFTTGLFNGWELFLANLFKAQPPVDLLPGVQDVVSHPERAWSTGLWQIVRFALVGALNTTIDLITLNILL